MIKPLILIFICAIFLNAQTTFKYYQEIHNAIRSGDSDILKHTLIKSNNFINEKDKFGFTPLHLAVRLENKEMVKLLLDEKAQVNTQDSFGDTPLIESARNNYPQILKLLICAKADKGLKNNYEQSVMNFISQNKQYELAIFIQNPQCENSLNGKKKQLIDRLRKLE